MGFWEAYPGSSLCEILVCVCVCVSPVEREESKGLGSQSNIFQSDSYNTEVRIQSPDGIQKELNTPAVATVLA